MIIGLVCILVLVAVAAFKISQKPENEEDMNNSVLKGLEDALAIYQEKKAALIADLSVEENGARKVSLEKQIERIQTDIDNTSAKIAGEEKSPVNKTSSEKNSQTVNNSASVKKQINIETNYGKIEM